jgi:hypothetical protein
MLIVCGHALSLAFCSKAKPHSTLLLSGKLKLDKEQKAVLQIRPTAQMQKMNLLLMIWGMIPSMCNGKDTSG